MKILIIGGTGVISREIVYQLHKQGNEIVLYNREIKKLEDNLVKLFYK